jgi:hypothetical protein
MHPPQPVKRWAEGSLESPSLPLELEYNGQDDVDDQEMGLSMHVLREP